MKTNLLIAICLALPFSGFTPLAFAQIATVEFASSTYGWKENFNPQIQNRSNPLKTFERTIQTQP